MEDDSGAPNVDFSMQFSLAKSDERGEKRILETLQHLVGEVAHGRLTPLGALVVFGDFGKHGPVISGMVQMKPKQNPIESLKMIDTKPGYECILEYSQAPHDGAVIIDRSGQIIGAGIYLVVEDPTLDMPDDCGTRHKAAASFSKRSDVISVLTLSEETNTVRIWKKGKQVHVYKATDENDQGKVIQDEQTNVKFSSDGAV